MFTQYRDGSGVRLHANQIGEWNKINASWAILYSPALGLGYKINIPPGLEAFRGRETNVPDLCWSGVILSVPPKIAHLGYTISIGPMKRLMEGRVEP